METWSLLSCTLEMPVMKSFLMLQAFFFLLGCRWSAKLLRPIYLKFFLNEIRMFIL